MITINRYLDYDEFQQLGSEAIEAQLRSIEHVIGVAFFGRENSVLAGIYSYEVSIDTTVDFELVKEAVNNVRLAFHSGGIRESRTRRRTGYFKGNEYFPDSEEEAMIVAIFYPSIKINWWRRMTQHPVLPRTLDKQPSNTVLHGSQNGDS